MPNKYAAEVLTAILLALDAGNVEAARRKAAAALLCLQEAAALESAGETQMPTAL